MGSARTVLKCEAAVKRPTRPRVAHAPSRQRARATGERTRHAAASSRTSSAKAREHVLEGERLRGRVGGVQRDWPSGGLGRCAPASGRRATRLLCGVGIGQLPLATQQRLSARPLPKQKSGSGGDERDADEQRAKVERLERGRARPAGSDPATRENADENGRDDEQGASEPESGGSAPLCTRAAGALRTSPHSLVASWRRMTPVASTASARRASIAEQPIKTARARQHSMGGSAAAASSASRCRRRASASSPERAE
eukprot:scaffold4701_cov25-Tisochrysis_lutea.AAC.1